MNFNSLKPGVIIETVFPASRNGMKIDIRNVLAKLLKEHVVHFRGNTGRSKKLQKSDA